MKKLSMVRRSVIFLLLIWAVTLASSATGDVPGIVSLKMESSEGVAKCIIEKNGDIDIQNFQLQNPKRLVLDFIGARHQLGEKLFMGDGKLVDRVRTSQFTSSPQEVTRVVFDIKDNASYKIETPGNRVVVEFFSGTGQQGTPVRPSATKAAISPVDAHSWTAKPQADRQTAEKTEKPVASTPPTAAPTRSEWASRTPAPSQKEAQGNWTGARTEQPEASIANAWRKGAGEETAGTGYGKGSGGSASAPAAGGFKNRPITIDVQNADIKSVLNGLSEFSSTNIISGPEVTGPVTAHLKNVPWRQALSIILKSHGYGFREEYGVIRVSTIEKLTKEELDLQAADRQKDDLLPLSTKIIPLSFANAEEIKEALEKIASKRGSIETEEGSNSLVVTDIDKNIKEIERLAVELDVKLKQVEIVAKMVDVDFEATKEFGIHWEALNLAPANVSVLGDATVDALTTNPVGTFRVGTVQSWGEIMTVIEMLQRDNKANIISNPRIVTADNREANILVGKEVPLIVSDEAGNPITELTKVGIGLRVTPHVNSDNTITMDLHPEVSELSAQATVQGGVIISVSEADTRVVVADGETAVIGGLINEVESKIESGLPVLKDFPILGNLFKFKNDTTKKRELIIFVTPRIIGTSVGSS